MPTTDRLVPLSPLHAPHAPVRVGVVGTGHVGATFAYTLLISGLANEIVLIDKDHRRAEGEAMDLLHSTPFLPSARVIAGGWDDLEGAQVVAIAAGVSQAPGEGRLDLLKRNAEVFRDIVPRIVERARSAVLLVATNPVDVLSYAVWEISGLPPGQVIGSGTVLDSARLRALLSEHYRVDARSVHAHILGEHGDSEVPAWSLANIAGMKLSEYCVSVREECSADILADIFHRTRDAAYEIIERKGATYYAVAAAMVRIVEAIVRDEHSVLPVSTLLQGQYGISDVFLSVPSVVGTTGVEHVLELPLSDGELRALRQSAEVLRQSYRSLLL